MPKNMEIRIKRPRTPAKDSVFEILERWASLEGRTLANAVEYLLESRSAHGRFQLFCRDERNPGKATT